jgi:hypothetical protein
VPTLAENGTRPSRPSRPRGKSAGQQCIDDLETCVADTRDLLQRI